MGVTDTGLESSSQRDAEQTTRAGVHWVGFLQAVRVRRLSSWRITCLWGFVSALVFLGVGIPLLASVATELARWGAAFAGAAYIVSLWLVLKHRRYLVKASLLDVVTWLEVPVSNIKRDLLSAVELSAQRDQEGGFSKALIDRFLESVDQDLRKRAFPFDVNRRLEGRTRWISVGILVLALGAFGWKRETWFSGMAKWLGASTAATMTVKEPITSEIELTYHFPAYSGLEPKTVKGSNGEISALKGTEVELKTQADRDVEQGVIEFRGQRLSLQKQGSRQLQGKMVVDKAGTYHFSFLRFGRVVAQGPEISVKVEPDNPPTVQWRKPTEDLELDERQETVSLEYEASDDFGLTALSLVYRVTGQPERRIAFAAPTGRSVVEKYQWNVSGLALAAGQSATFFIEAVDNDTISGMKKSQSRTLTLKRYSAQEHRRAAVAQVAALWEQWVQLLADRLESPERTASVFKREDALAGQHVDARTGDLVRDTLELASKFRTQKDAPPELSGALFNMGTQTKRDVAETGSVRRLSLRVTEARTVVDVAERLRRALETEVGHVRQSVLYLESLLDRQKMADLKELSQQLKADRHDLQRLLEEYQRSGSEQAKAALMQQMQTLREHMKEVMQRMAELSKGIRDEFINQEALQELMEQQDMGSKLDDVEKLIKDGKVEDAMKSLQALSMQMDEFLEQLDSAQDRAQQEVDPELTRAFQNFSKGLQETVAQQEKLAQATEKLSEKSKQAFRQAIEKKGAALKKELIEKIDKLRKNYQPGDSAVSDRLEGARQETIEQLSSLRNALQNNNFDLGLDISNGALEAAMRYQSYAEQQARMDEAFHNPANVRRASRELMQQSGQNARDLEGIKQKLENLFPKAGEGLTPQEQSDLRSIASQQKKLEQQARELGQQMEQLQKRAPIFDPQAEQQMDQAQQRMQQASEQLSMGNAHKGRGEQQGALEQLQSLQQQMSQNNKSGKKGGLPLPMSSRGMQGMNGEAEKVEIPADDPNRASRQLRQEVIDAMKQSTPQKYEDSVKKYYEGLVK